MKKVQVSLTQPLSISSLIMPFFLPNSSSPPAQSRRLLSKEVVWAYPILLYPRFCPSENGAIRFRISLLPKAVSPLSKHNNLCSCDDAVSMNPRWLDSQRSSRSFHIISIAFYAYRAITFISTSTRIQFPSNLAHLRSIRDVSVNSFPTSPPRGGELGGKYSQKTYHKKASGQALQTVKRHSKPNELKIFGSCFWFVHPILLDSSLLRFWQEGTRPPYFHSNQAVSVSRLV